MKKVVLVLVSVLIITVFVAFNYLLWDREKFMDVDASKNATINALSKQIQTLNDENSQLKNKNFDLDYELKKTKDEVTKLEQEKEKTKTTVDLKNEIIFNLKKNVDLSPLKDIIEKWTENINKAQYEAAYSLMGKLEKPQTLSEFSNNYRISVSNIKITSINLVTESYFEDKKGDIVFKVNMEVKRAEGENKWTFYTEGPNEKYFYFVYDKDKKVWVINNIANLY